MSLLVTPELVGRLVEIHVRRYENHVRRAREGAKGYRLDECERLLGIWRRVQLVTGQPWLIDEAGRREIQDAIYSEGELEDVPPPGDGVYDFGAAPG